MRLLGRLKRPIYNGDDLSFQIRSDRGAYSRVANNGTAFAHRETEVLLVSPIFMPAGSSENQRLEALRLWQDLLPFIKAYANLLGTATEKDVALAYPDKTYVRLSEIK